MSLKKSIKLIPFIAGFVLLVGIVPVALALVPWPEQAAGAGQDVIVQVDDSTHGAGEEAEAALTSPPLQEDSGPDLPPDKMVFIAGNRTSENITVTVTIAGGEYGQGQQFPLGVGEERRFDLAPGPYTATWSSPGGNGWGRRFEAAAGAVVLTWAFPEEDALFSEVQQGAENLAVAQGQEIGQLTLPSVVTTTSPFIPPDGKALYVLSNRSLAGLPSYLTVYGGKFGEEGREITLNPFQVVSLAVEPGDYRLVWTAPKSFENQTEEIGLKREGTATAGKVVIGWIIPEEARAYAQRPGEPGQQFELIPLEGGN
jgi:hypothetical protein